MSNYQIDSALLPLLPPFYREVLDYQEICSTEESELSLLAAAINNVANNFQFQAMDVETVSMWEQVFKIIPSPTTETLDFRRARIINRISTRPPFTLNFLKKKLDELIGVDAWTISVDYPNYTFYVESSAENQQYESEVSFTIGKIKPAHMVYVNRPYVVSGMLLSEQIDVAQRVFNYRLGSWGLGVDPFATEQSQGVIKLPSTPSIQPALLTGTANFVSSDIAKARINGAIVISDIAKSVLNSTLTVTYTLTAAQTNEITLVELLDADDTVLTASSVYVPVTQSTIMKHTIPVSEGVNNG